MLRFSMQLVLSAVVGIFLENQESAMAIDAVAPYSTRSSAVLVLNTWNERATIFHQKGCQQHVQFKEEENPKILLFP